MELAAGVYDVPDNKYAVFFYYNANTSFTDYFVLLGRFETSTDNIKMQACEVYGINKMRAKDNDASDIYM